MAASLFPMTENYPFMGWTMDLGYKYDYGGDHIADRVSPGYYDTRPESFPESLYGYTTPENLRYHNGNPMDWEDPDDVAKWYDYEWGNPDYDAFYRTRLTDFGGMTTEQLDARGGKVINSWTANLNPMTLTGSGFYAGMEGKPYDPYYPGLVHAQGFMPSMGNRLVQIEDYGSAPDANKSKVYKTNSQYYDNPVLAMNHLYFSDKPVEGLENLHFTNWDNNGQNNWYSTGTPLGWWENRDYGLDGNAAFNDLYLQKENAYRKEQESAYNSLVDKYNWRYNKAEGNIGNFGSQIAGFDINNIQNQGDFLTNLGKERNRLNTINLEELFGMKPRTGDIWGAFDKRYENMKDNTPRHRTALDAYDPRVKKLGFGEDALRVQLDNILRMDRRFKDLKSDRAAAVSRDDAFRGRMNESIDSYWKNAQDEDIYAQGILDMLQSQYGDLSSNLSGYKSDLANPNFGGIKNELKDIGSWLGTQRGKYNAEANRISDFERMLGNKISSFDNTLDNLSIKNISGINSLDKNVGNLIKQAEGFKSPIQTDLGQFIGSLGGIDSRIDSLRNRRNTELERVSDARNSFGSALTGLLEKAPNLNLRAGSQFDNANAQIDNLLSRIQGFQSELDPNMSDLVSKAQQAKQAVGNRYQERRSLIDDIVNQAQQQRQGAYGVNLWEEGAMRDALDEILRLRDRDLSLYTGNDLAGDTKQITSQADAVKKRLQQLTNKRGSIEGQARGLLDQIDPRKLYGMSDIDRARGMYDQLAGEADLYNATQANDELQNVIDTVIGGQRRLENDYKLREERDAAAQQSVQNPHGINRNLANSIDVANLSLEEYAALVSRIQEQDYALADRMRQQYGRLFG